MPGGSYISMHGILPRAAPQVLMPAWGIEAQLMDAIFQFDLVNLFLFAYLCYSSLLHSAVPSEFVRR